MDFFQILKFCFDIGTGISCLLLAIITYTKPETKKIPSIYFIGLYFIFFAIVKFCDGIGTFLSNNFIIRIYGISFFLFVLFLIIGINYIVQDNAISLSLFIAFGFGILLLFISLQPNIGQVVMKNGYKSVLENDLFNGFIYALAIIGAYYIFYWGLKTWLNVPFYIRKDAIIFFIGIILSSIITMIVQSLSMIIPTMSIFVNITILSGSIILLYVIFKEPKLLYILPFIIYRIIVRNREGHSLYDHDWTESEINDDLFTGFLNAIQIMSEEIMKIGGVLDINLHDGILVLYESTYISVGLVSSKSSKLLREAVRNFTNDFEILFERLLKKKCRERNEFEDAYKLIEKHFSKFPYRTSKDKNHPLTLSYKQKKLPLETEKNLKKILEGKDEFEIIKNDMLKCPDSLSSDFFTLYKDLEKEIDDVAHEEEKKEH